MAVLDGCTSRTTLGALVCFTADPSRAVWTCLCPPCAVCWTCHVHARTIDAPGRPNLMGMDATPKFTAQYLEQSSAG